MTEIVQLTNAPAVMPWQPYADAINAEWRKSVEGIFKVANLVLDARESLDPDNYKQMFNELPFSHSTGHQFCAIAQDERLQSELTKVSLPPSYRSIYEISTLSDEDLKEAIEGEIVHPDMGQAEIVQWKSEKKRKAKLEELKEETEKAANELGQKLYPVICADPPWKFETFSEKGKTLSAENHYPCSSTNDIADIPCPSTENAVLFLWATVPMLPDALDVMAAWGFTYKSHMAWVKDRSGTGYWCLNKHELLLIGTKGNIPAPAPEVRPKSAIEADRAEHSVKPQVFYDLIAEMYPDLPRLEMFARDSRDGWDVWGNEAG